MVDVSGTERRDARRLIGLGSAARQHELDFRLGLARGVTDQLVAVALQDMGAQQVRPVEMEPAIGERLEQPWEAP